MARILVIDDDPVSRSILRELLSGHEVDEADTTDSGIELYSTQAFDAVITDLFIPERGGLEVIRVIISKNPDARLMAVSGIGINERGELLTMAIEAGARKTMKKPLDPKEFRIAVEDLLTST